MNLHFRGVKNKRYNKNEETNKLPSGNLSLTTVVIHKEYHINNYQRDGSQSNAKIGADFENLAKKIIQDELKIILQEQYSLNIGLTEREPKQHNFDLGNESYIVECKSHKWTSGNNIPSAKLTVWNEAMYYFLVAPKNYKKIFFMIKDYNQKRKMTLAEYYLKTYRHLIPVDVEFWEYDEVQEKINILLERNI